jgi:hypothetical protein
LIFKEFFYFLKEIPRQIESVPPNKIFSLAKRPEQPTHNRQIHGL